MKNDNKNLEDMSQKVGCIAFSNTAMLILMIVALFVWGC